MAIRGANLVPSRSPREFAARLAAARVRRIPIPPISDERELSESFAYRIQAELVSLYEDPPSGYKLGFTSEAMRRQMGVANPNFGRLTESMCLSGPDVDFERFIHPRVEPEIALLTRKTLEGPVPDADQLGVFLQAAMPALEVVDSRFQEYRFRAEDNIADNSSAAAYLLGPPIPVSASQYSTLEIQLVKNGQPAGSGTGRDALGGPLNALNWLLGRLQEKNLSLPANSIVMTGGLTRAETARRNDTFMARLPTLNLEARLTFL